MVEACDNTCLRECNTETTRTFKRWQNEALKFPEKSVQHNPPKPKTLFEKISALYEIIETNLYLIREWKLSDSLREIISGILPRVALYF